MTVNTECDLLDPSFMPVAAVARLREPERRRRGGLKEGMDERVGGRIRG